MLKWSYNLAPGRFGVVLLDLARPSLHGRVFPVSPTRLFLARSPVKCYKLTSTGWVNAELVVLRTPG